MTAAKVNDMHATEFGRVIVVAAGPWADVIQDLELRENENTLLMPNRAWQRVCKRASELPDPSSVVDAVLKALQIDAEEFQKAA
jgi:glycerol-3-phosphate dehydrogenase